MKQNQILLISIILAGIVVIIYDKLLQLKKKRHLMSAIKRFGIIREKERLGEIKKEVVCIGDGVDEVDRRIDSSGSSRIVIDGKLYTDKTSWFLKKENKLYIYGKKEDFLVELYGDLFNN